ncbi:MAG TPA: thermonuclease family protein [Bacillales bacterium]|nr:thermonuclease family protein [Bacillales bacterium]
MKYAKRMSLFVVLLLMFAGGCGHSAKPGYVPVTHVTDGDTIDVKINGKVETVRLLLIDTPETVHPNMPMQPFGPAAHRFTEHLLTGKKVKLEVGKDPRDKYGRLLAYVYTEKGKMVNELLLKKGLARVAYVFPPDTKYVDRFRKIENSARAAELGIWSVKGYATSHGFITTLCQIKGNVTKSGQRIFHVPTDPYYAQTKAEAYFCTKKAAEAAGFRAPHY